jgi:hypothetical protein
LFRVIKIQPPSGRSVPLHAVLCRATGDYTVTRYSAWHVCGHPAVCISAGKSGARRRRAYLAHASAVRSWDEGIPRADTARHLAATKRICLRETPERTLETEIRTKREDGPHMIAG